tara:strand:- start:17 stop:1078 length:1062 start_codon:yes stop_codon:yes gene_type:complete
MKLFNLSEDVVSTEITVTDGFFDGGKGIVAGTSMTTSSLSTDQKKYYYNIQYNSKDHLSVTYGHIAGSGSMEQSTNVEGETQAVYKQFYNITETDRQKLKTSQGFSMNSVTQSDAYFCVAERLQMKDRINPGTWTFQLSGSEAEEPATPNTSTGVSLYLTDDSKTTEPTAAPFGERYNIVSGAAGTVHTEAADKTYGYFYPDAGLWILSANELSSSVPGQVGFEKSGSGYSAVLPGQGLSPDTRVTADADNAFKIATALQKGEVTLRSEEHQYIYDYFCRAKANEYNYSNNITFWSGSDYRIRHDDMQNNPQTYITEVGLYDEAGELMAIGRLSSALEKNFSSEAVVKVRLTY